MRIFTVFILALTILTSVGCSDSSGSGSNQDSLKGGNSVDVDGGSPGEEPIDYTTIVCSDLEECKTACDFIAPATTEQYIRSAYCAAPSFSSLGASVCNSIVSYHQSTYLNSNAYCKSSLVAEVIEPTWLEDEICADDGECNRKCLSKFKPKTDEEIIRKAAAAGTLRSGGTMRELVRNAVLREQLQSCLESPIGLVREEIY